MERHIKIRKLNYIFLIILFSFCLHTQLFSDLGSISPTISEHIYTTQWASAGLEGGDLCDDFPVISGTIYVPEPNDHDADSINYAIDEAYDEYLVHGGIWAVMLQPSSAGKYVVNKTIEMKSNVILCGPYQWKEDKDEDDRAIIEFDIIDYGGVDGYNRNCIHFKGTEQIQLENAGVEDVYIKRIDTSGNPTGTRTGVNIYMENCNNCFVSGVESWYPQNHHVTMYDCNHIEVRGCYFHDAQDFGDDGDGYGVVCDNSNHCLIEDNIFDHLRHSMLIQNDSKYNVFGYNYSINAKQNSTCLFTDDFSGDMVCHGHPVDNIPGPFRNLFEGNIGQFMWVDCWHKCNGPDNTFHRNAALKHGYHIYPFQKVQNMVNNFLKEDNRWYTLFLGFPRQSGLSFGIFESYTKYVYRDIWGNKKTKELEQNYLVEFFDSNNGGCQNTYLYDISYYHNSDPNLTNGWPFEPDLHKNFASMRYEIECNFTKSRFDDQSLPQTFTIHESIEIPDNPGPVGSLLDDCGNYGFLAVPANSKLIVDQGVTLKFAQGWGIKCEGFIEAKGTIDEPIKFTSINTNEEWLGILIDDLNSITNTFTTFEYCEFENAVSFEDQDILGGALTVNLRNSYSDNMNVLIKNCKFHNNEGIKGGAIFIKSPVYWNSWVGVIGFVGGCIIEDSEIYENSAEVYGGGIYLEKINATIRNNSIHDNECTTSFGGSLIGGGIVINNHTGIPGYSAVDIPITIVNNLVYNNRGDLGAGIYLEDNMNTKLFNNTFSGNVSNLKEYSAQVYSYYTDDVGLYDSYFCMLNNILFTLRINIPTAYDFNPTIDFCNNWYTYPSGNTLHVYNRDENSYQFLQNSQYTDNFNNNISSYSTYTPGFIAPCNGNFNLQYESCCRDEGIIEEELLLIDNLNINDWHNFSQIDLNNSPRIAAEIVDMGAYEYYEPGIYIIENEIDFGFVVKDLSKVETFTIGVKEDCQFDVSNIEINIPDSLQDYYTIINEDEIPTLQAGETFDVEIEFCCHKMFVFCDGLITITSSDPYMPEVQMMVYGRPALDNAWNWISFPALDRDANGNQDAEEVLEPLVPAGQPNAHQIVTYNGEMIYNLSTGQWDHYNLDDIVSTVGYKLEMFKNYDYYPFSIVGDSITLIPADTEIHLEEGYNWIGYWLPQSQNFDEAFGIDNGNFDKVISIQAENWYYSLPESPATKGDPYQSSPLPSARIRPLHYGRGYIVNMSEPIDLVWNDPDGDNTKEKGYAKTEAFSFDEKETYEVIDVIGLDVSAQEIGVFNSGAECLGAAKIDSLGSAQILAYKDTQTREGTELTFCIYQGKSIKESNNYLLYDFDLEEFIEAPLKAGTRKYNIVLFDSNNPQLLDKLILRQNIPNPFNHKMKNTSISFALPQKDKVMLKIYNIKGQLIKTIINNKEMDAGYYTVQWDGRNEDNVKVCNGVYLYKIENSNSSIIKKMIILE